MPSSPYDRHAMTEEQKVAARRHAKYLEYLRSTGKPAKCTPEETAQALKHVRMLKYRYGMTPTQMAEDCGLSESTINDYIRGYRNPSKGIRPVTQIPRENYTTVLNLRPAPPRGGPKGRGAIIPVQGTRRRLQALVHAGYGYTLLRDLLGWCNFQNIWQIAMSPDTKVVTWGTLQEVDVVYQKYINEDPREILDCTGYAYSRAHNTAKRHQFAPASCWDEDTLDDPDAIPEWTGACGTVEGYYLHLKYDILVRNWGPKGEHGYRRRKVLCEPCVKARTFTEGGIAQTPEASLNDNIIEALRRGMPYRVIAEQFFVGRRTIQGVADELKKTGWTPNSRGARPMKKKEET